MSLRNVGRLAVVLALPALMGCPEPENPPDVTRVVGAVLTRALGQYREQRGMFPETISTLCPGQKACDDLGADQRPNDGWGRQFHYQRTREAYDLTSSGADGQLETNDDIPFSSAKRANALRTAGGCWMFSGEPARILSTESIRLDTVMTSRGEFGVEGVRDYASSTWVPWIQDSILISFVDSRFVELRVRATTDSLVGSIRTGLHGRTSWNGRFNAVRLIC